MTNFEFGPEKRLSRLTLARVEKLNSLFTEIAAAISSKIGFTSGNVDFEGGRAVNAANGVDPTDLVTRQQLDATAFSPALPGQTGNAGKFVTTDGTTASWSDGPVRSDIAQLLSDPRKTQARSNIGAASSAEVALKADSAETATALSAKADSSAVSTAIAAAQFPIGASLLWNSQTLPSGYLKENGAAVSRTTYAALDAAIYVGDALNATAAAGYRCTNPANPNGSRSTTGTHIVLPDGRGVGVRGLDDGRGLDSGRTLHSYQPDQNLSHTHTGVTDVRGAHQHEYQGFNGDLTIGTAPGLEYGSALTGVAGAHDHNLIINASGGSDVRVKTIAKLVIIRAF